MTSHLYGRPRNCYALAVRYNIGALELAVKLRRLKKKDAGELWEDRLDGVANTLSKDVTLVARCMRAGQYSRYQSSSPGRQRWTRGC